MGKLNYLLRYVQAHADKGYDYSDTVYVNAKTKIGVRCPRHGVFWQLPSNHLKGGGCPRCMQEKMHQGSFKNLCKAQGIDYWRALKRREAGMSDDKVLSKSHLRSLRTTNTALSVNGVSYPNIRAACAALKPIASETTILRWIQAGVSAEEAFARIPNPGYRQGIIYAVTHKVTGKQYIGLTIQSLDRRWRYHQEQAAAGHIKDPSSLHAPIREFGADAFDLTVIDRGRSKADLEAKERTWIATRNTVAPNGYNLDAGGVSGGSSAKSTTYNGKTFKSVHEATLHLMEVKGIGYEAAKKRLSTGRTEVTKPAARGQSLVKTKTYKAWSTIVHAATNAASKGYIPGATMHEPWREFAQFHADVGDAPADMCFARKDKSKPYCPDNCAWMTKSEASKINAAHMKAKGTLSGRSRASRAD